MAKPGRKIQKLKPNGGESNRAIDASRGSDLWKFNHIRMKILTSLLDDLIDLENEGLDDTYCVYIQRALEKMANAVTDVPSGGFLSWTPLHTEIEEFADLYFKWNAINGISQDNTRKRRELLRKLRDKRQRITDKSRRLQLELSNNLDFVLVEASYQSIGDVIKLVPDVFKSLASAYADYKKAIPV